MNHKGWPYFTHMQIYTYTSRAGLCTQHRAPASLRTTILCENVVADDVVDDEDADVDDVDEVDGVRIWGLNAALGGCVVLFGILNRCLDMLTL